VRRALVTGAASGIGRRWAGALALRGHRVLATDVDLDALARARAEDRWPESLETTALDVRRAEEWDAAVRIAETRLGGLDLLLNVAGFLRPGRVLDADPIDVARQLEVNALGVILGTQAAARRMVLRGEGHIVNVGSLASLSPVPGLGAYCASKWAVRGFTLSAAVELAEHGVAVTLLMPDAVATPMLDLQVGHDAAALTFSGDRALGVDELERALFDEVLPKRPLELTVPASRGLLARAAGVVPAASRWLYPWLKKKGEAGQRRARGG
jgi:3-oxoacyl-[acyl-carrier protein] reductase